MAVKIYRAKDLCEAFALIQNDFGLNATILETREVRSRKFFGLFRGESGVEVVATDEETEDEETSLSKRAPNVEETKPFLKNIESETPGNESEQTGGAWESEFFDFSPVCGSAGNSAEGLSKIPSGASFCQTSDRELPSDFGVGSSSSPFAAADEKLEPLKSVGGTAALPSPFAAADEKLEPLKSVGGTAAFPSPFAAADEKLGPLESVGGTAAFPSPFCPRVQTFQTEEIFSCGNASSRFAEERVAETRSLKENLFGESVSTSWKRGSSCESVSNCAVERGFSVEAESRFEIGGKKEAANRSGFRKRRSSAPPNSHLDGSRVVFPGSEFPGMDSRLLFGKGNSFFSRISGCSPENPVSAPFRDALFQIYSKLQTADMDEYSIAELTSRLREDELLYAAAGKREPNANFHFLERRLQELVSQEILTTGPIPICPGKLRTVALVGPTGVGKTTTIAKLAIDYRQKKNCQVGLVTFDLSRMGAVEQLQTFADVIGIPMLCASTKRQLRDAIARMSDFDLVLIDTAGQSRAGESSLQEMRVFFEAAQVNSVMLVLSATARTRLLTQTVEAFKSLGTTSLILTKLDESLGLGNLFPLLRTAGLPVSYLTTGQKVPDDFETADRERLAKLILGDAQIH